MQEEDFAMANNQIANIYQSMLNGDKSALQKLQQLNPITQLPQIPHSKGNRRSKLNTEVNVSRQEQPPQTQGMKSRQEASDFHISSSVANVGSRKEDMYMNAIKRGAKMGVIPQNQHVDRFFKPVRRLVQSQNQEYQSHNNEIRQAKKSDKQEKSRQQLSVEMRSNKTDTTSITKNNKIYALPKVQKHREGAKAESVHTTAKKHASISEHQKPVKEQKQRPKVDFKQAIGKNKQQRFQFSKQNQEQLALQMQIIALHRNKKDFLGQIKDKYELDFNNKQKYLKKKVKPEYGLHLKSKQQEQDPQPQKEILNRFESRMQEQKNKCRNLNQEITSLKILFNKNLANINKLQHATAALPYAKYLENHAESITQISEEEDDTVEPLETQADHKNKYRHLMAHTRDRKWGLMQRTQYEAHRAETMSQSRHTGTESQFTQNNESRYVSGEKEGNKVVINQRLKNLLFT